MTDGIKTFEQTVAWAKALDLGLHPEIERKCVNGVWGLYAKSALPEGTLLAAIPVDKLLPVNHEDYPKQASPSARHIHTAARIYSGNESASFEPMFALFEPLESLQQYATFFANEKELNALKDISPTAFAEARLQNQRLQTLIDALCRFDDTTDRETYTLMTLNYFSRGIGNLGFVPVLDCFNHSDRHGQAIDTRDGRASVKAAKNLQAGEQAYVSYGTLDMLQHAIHYNYFDSDNPHFIHFGKRFKFPVITAQEQQFAQQLSRQHPVGLEQMNGIKAYSVDDPEAWFGEDGPSRRLIELAKAFAVRNPKGKHGNYLETLRLWLDTLDANNKVDKFANKHLSKRLRRFYPLLKKEKQLIAANRQWVKKQMSQKTYLTS